MFVARWRGRGGPWHVFRTRPGYSELWKAHLWGGLGLSSIRPSFYDSGGIGVPDLSGNEHGQRRGQRRHHAATLAILLGAATLAGCHSSNIADAKTADAATTWQSIHDDFLHGNLDVAHQRADKARRDYSAVHPDWATKFSLLDAEILIYQGRRLDVIALLNAPGVSYPVAGDDAIKRNLLCALAHAGLGQAQQADLELEQARSLSGVSKSKLKDEVLGTEALVQIDRDHLPEAAQLFRESLLAARARRDSFVEATDLLNLGFLSLRLEHYDEALVLLTQASDFARPIQAQPIIQEALGNMGVAYSALGDFEKALSNFEQAQQVARQAGTTSAQIDWLWSAGSAYYNLGNLEAATKCYQQALQGAVAIHSPQEIAGVHTQLAFLFYQEGKFDAARTHSEEAIRSARIAGDKPAEMDPLFLQALLAAREPNGQDAERMLVQLHGQSAEVLSLRGQIEDALANLYAARHQLARADLWYRKSIHTFEDQRATVKDEELRLPFFANGDTLYRDYANFLITSQKQQKALQLLDIGRARTLAEGLRPGGPGSRVRPASRPANAVTPQAVARKLNATFLFYSLGPEKSYLWAVTANRTRLFPLTARSAIEAQVQTYQKAILRSSDPIRDANKTAMSLYETLVSPAAAMIPRGSKVFIIPDGALNGLNFETLLTPAKNNSHYWIEDVTVTSANSIGLLSRLDQSSPAVDEKLLLIGNPVAAGTGYENLMNAFAEIRGIEKHFSVDNRTVVTQSEAVPASYAQSTPEQFSYIHFVAHGTASRLDPLDSAVVLSPPAQHPESFKLYARDIMRYPLHARLVTISACYGSGLRAYAGEGLVGLSWAFLRAGAHNVIGALWEVNDASTPLLMDRLYGEIEAGKTPDAALRTAKLSLIHSSGVYRKPLYWGGFQIYAGS
jgi:CHAT domain-containing protein